MSYTRCTRHGVYSPHNTFRRAISIFKLSQRKPFKTATTPLSHIFHLALNVPAEFFPRTFQFLGDFKNDFHAMENFKGNLQGRQNFKMVLKLCL
jgi:hypothetical protein